MKKYVKPDLVYENFELSQNIAACGWDMNQAHETVCTAEGDPQFGNYAEVTLFTETPRCLMVFGKDSEIYCYETSSEQYRIFNS